MRKTKKSFWFAALLMLVFCLLPMSALATNTSDDITVFVSIEGYTIGHGFFVEPFAVDVPAGSNVMDATIYTLGAHGLTHAGGATGISRIYGINAPHVANPPRFIRDEIYSRDGTSEWGTYFVWTPYGSTDGSLGNNDFFTWSGWMVTVNHIMPDVGASAVTLSDGDVIRWQFSMLVGDDLGFGWGDPLYTHEDKTDLIRALFADEATPAARDAALSVIIEPLATAAQISDALARLVSIVPPMTGIPDITALIAAMLGLVAVSAVLWGFMLRGKLWAGR